jgi:hypothetical protein
MVQPDDESDSRFIFNWLLENRFVDLAEDKYAFEMIFTNLGSRKSRYNRAGWIRGSGDDLNGFGEKGTLSPIFPTPDHRSTEAEID